MKDVFQVVLLRFALVGLAVSLAALALRSRTFRDVQAQLLSAWRGLSPLGRFAACAFLLVGVIYGGGKTNGVNNLPLQQMQQAGGYSQAGLSGSLPLAPSAPNPVNLVNPVQDGFALRKAANWNLRGAWKDSFWLDFPGGWVFPHGTNHLRGVEVLSRGLLWPSPFVTNAVASVGVPVEIVPGLTSFDFGFTPSNTCRFAWTDAAVGRDADDLVTAEIELFRNGDILVVTNGVSDFRPRELPFPHDGYGQDDEWVSANFTNATEIASAGGYAAWVDAQVGEGLLNGLYKLTVALAEEPPETTFISVGDLSVAVTNAGECAFLLEKGEEYALSFFPPSSNITISVVDDVAAPRGPPLRSGWTWGDVNAGSWVADVGMYVTDYFPGMASAYCSWLPTLCGSPDVLSIPDEETVRFYAHLLDYAHPDDVAFEWSVCDGLVAATPDERETDITVESGPSWSDALVSVVATLGSGFQLFSWLDFTIFGGYDPHPVDPLSWIELSVPRAMFANDDDDNNDGTNDWECVRFDIPENDVVSGSVSFLSTVATSGTIRVSVSGFAGDVYTNKTEVSLVASTFDVPVERSSGLSIPLYINPYWSSSHLGPSVTATWIPEGGATQTSVSRFTVVEPVAEPICAETKTVSGHVYTINPCGVAVGDDAYFKVGVLPAAFPDSDIVWTNYDGLVEFVGGDRGREVHVRGKAVGETELNVIIGGRTQFAPSFTLNVVTPQTFKITAWIVSNDKQELARDVADVVAMIAPLNDIYRQVGVSFYLDSITVTNIPVAYNLLYGSTTNDVWNFDRLVDIGQSTGGIECYFVNDLVRPNGKQGPMAANCDCGLVMTAGATTETLAHEIGHAFGLKDVYASNREKDPTILSADELQVNGEKIHFSSCAYDWNGGCQGHGNGGERYYSQNSMLRNVLHRLVMYGVDQTGGNQRDIPIGSVRGVWYTESDGTRQWHLSDAPVGFFSDNIYKKASPAHQ